MVSRNIADFYGFAAGEMAVVNRQGKSIGGSAVTVREITNGTVTPPDWDSIDGTFYVDEENQPWMIFVHEWVCTDDHIGRMAATKLSDDLTHFVSEPVELFRADAPVWARDKVTGCCLRILMGRCICPFIPRTPRWEIAGRNRYWWPSTRNTEPLCWIKDH